MKAENSLLWVYTAIGVVSAVTTAYFLYQSRMEHWKMEARYAFAEVIKREVSKRSEQDVFFLTSGAKKLSPEPERRKAITVISEYGTIEYAIPRYKDSLNIERNWSTRGLYTILFEDHPLKADSLNIAWNGFLQQAGFPGSSLVRLSITDLLGREKQTCSDASVGVSQFDSLTTCYIGQRCENEISGFIRCPWRNVFLLKDGILLGAIIALCFLLFFLEKKFVQFYRRFFVREVVVEKEVPMMALKGTDVHIYKFGDVAFHTDVRILKRGDSVLKLPRQAATLLQLLIEAKGYRLSIGELQGLMWPTGDGSADKLHKAVERLRGYLSQISDWQIVNENYGYQLKSSYSIDENDNNALPKAD